MESDEEDGELESEHIVNTNPDTNGMTRNDPTANYLDDENVDLRADDDSDTLEDKDSAYDSAKPRKSKRDVEW